MHFQGCTQVSVYGQGEQANTKSEPGPDRGPRAGSPRGVVVATGRILKFFNDFALLASVLRRVLGRSLPLPVPISVLIG